MAMLGRESALRRREGQAVVGAARWGWRASRKRMRRAHDALMLRTILRVRGDGVGWAWIVDEVEDLFDPPLVHGRYRRVRAVSCIEGLEGAGVDVGSVKSVAGLSVPVEAESELEARD